MDFQQLTGLIPHLTVQGGVAALEYYKKALGAEELDRKPGPDGQLMHANMKVEGSFSHPLTAEQKAAAEKAFAVQYASK